MPSHQERREPLPKDYQFGDAGKPRIAIRFVREYDIAPDLKPQRWDDELRQHWNDIERGEH